MKHVKKNAFYVLMSGMMAFGLLSCDILTSSTGINLSGDWESRVKFIPEYPVVPAKEKSLDSVEVISNYTIVVTNDNDTLDSTSWEYRKEHYSAIENPDKFIMYNPNAGVLWPGNLVQGSSVASGVPDSIPVYKRLPIVLSLAILSGTKEVLTKTVANPTAATVNEALNTLLANYTGGTPGFLSYSFTDAYNSTQMESSLDLGFSGRAVDLSTKVGVDWTSKKRRVAVKLIQQFFTMTYNDPQGMAGVFNTNFTLADIEPYIGAGNPPCYISSVTYGRIYIMVFETESSSLDISAAIDFAYQGGVSGGSVKSAFDYQNVMANTSVKLFAMGGSAEDALVTANPNNLTNYSTMSNYLARGAVFSVSNVGVPISYTVRYLKNARLVRMNNTLEYDIEQAVPMATVRSPMTTIFSITLDRIVSLQQGETGDYVGTLQVFLNRENGTPDFSYTIPSYNWSSVPILNVATNFMITAPRQYGSYIKSILSVYQVTTNGVLDPYYRGVSVSKMTYNTNAKLWGDPITNSLTFSNANGSICKLAAAFTVEER